MQCRQMETVYVLLTGSDQDRRKSLVDPLGAQFSFLSRESGDTGNMESIAAGTEGNMGGSALASSCFFLL